MLQDEAIDRLSSLKGRGGIPGTPVFTAPEEMSALQRLKLTARAGTKKGLVEGFKEGGFIEATPFLTGFADGGVGDAKKLDKAIKAVEAGTADQEQFDLIVEDMIDRSRPHDALYVAAKGIKSSLAFGGEVALTGGVAALGRGLGARTIAKFGIKEGLVGRLAGAAVGEAARMTAIDSGKLGLDWLFGEGEAWSPSDLEAFRRGMPEFELEASDDGKLQLAMTEIGETITDKKWEARTSGYIELISERMGPALGAAFAKLPLGGKVMALEADFFKWMRGKGYSKTLDDVLAKVGKKAEINSALEEWFEERAGAVLRSATPGMEETLADVVPSFEQGLGEFLAAAVPGGGRALAGRAFGQSVEDLTGGTPSGQDRVNDEAARIQGGATMQTEAPTMQSGASSVQTDAPPAPSQPQTPAGTADEVAARGVERINSQIARDAYADEFGKLVEKGATEEEAAAELAPRIQEFVSANPVELVEIADEDREDADRFEKSQKKRGVDVRWYSTDSGEAASYPALHAGEGVVLVDAGLLQDKEALAKYFLHEDVHDIGSKARPVLDQMMADLREFDAKGLDAARETIQSDRGGAIARDLIEEEGAARRAEDLDAAIFYLQTRKGGEWLDKLEASEDRTMLQQVIDFVRSLLKKVGIGAGSFHDQKLAELSKAIGEPVTSGDLASARIIRAALAAAVTPKITSKNRKLSEQDQGRLLPPSERPTVIRDAAADLDTEGMTPKQAKRAKQKARKQAKKGEADRFAAAYHGSPHNFDKFSTDKIGTGEGAQAYGHGLYFASRREVAQHYRDSLSAGRPGGFGLAGVVPSTPDEGLADGGWVAAKELSQLLVTEPGIVRSLGDLQVIGRERVLSAMRRLMEDTQVLDSVVRLVPIDVVNVLAGKEYTPEYLLHSPTMLVHLLPATAQDLVPSSIEAVDVLVPLVAASAAKVHTGLGRFDVAPEELAAAGSTGQFGHDVLARIVPQPSEFTRGHGYQVNLAPQEDQYLLWDEPLSKQSEKVKGALEGGEYTLTVEGNPLTGRGIYEQLGYEMRSDAIEQGRNTDTTHPATQRAASQALLSAGIRGIKYLDGTSRGKGEGSYNYVLFDENDVQIVDRFAAAPKKDSPAFKRMVAAMAPELKNEDGTPKVLYHGTSKDFTIPKGMLWAAVDSNLASDYAYARQQIAGGAERILPVYLSAREIFNADALPKSMTVQDFARAVVEQSGRGWSTADREAVQKMLAGAREEESGPHYSRHNFWYGPGFAFGNEAASEPLAMLKRHGFDGVAMTENGTQTFGVFEPTQVKSALSNTTFDPSNPDIRFAAKRKPGQRIKEMRTFSFDLPDETSVELWRRRLQDEFLRVQRLEQELGEVSTDSSAYEAMSAASSKMRGAINQLRREYVEPIYDELRAIVKAGDTADDATEYLLARHAPSRNKVIGERNEDFADVEENPGSGIPTSEAEETVAATEAKPHAAHYKQLGKLVDAMNLASLQLRLDAGLLTQEQFDQYTTQWDHYMPFKTDMDASPYATGGGFSVKGQEFQMAGGRTTLPDAPLQFAIQQAYQSIERAEKNRVGLDFLNLLREHSDQVEFSEDQPEDYVAPDHLEEGQIALKENGKQVVISLPDALLARAIGRVGRVKLPAFMRWLNKAVRMFVATRTSLSPDFLMRNLARDLGAASVHISSEQSKGIAWRAVRGTAKAIRAAYQIRRGNLDRRREYHADYLEYEANGGLIGWYYTPDIAELTREATDLSKDVDPSMARKALSPIRGALAWMDDANHAIENGIRLSLYRELRKEGYSPKAAASAARNVTVDFTKKGEWSSVTNAAFIFSNASIQGNWKNLKVLATKRGKQFAAGFAATGFAATVANLLVGGDDDDGVPHLLRIPEEVRSSHIIILHPEGDNPIPGGEGHYFKIPLPYGWSSFFALGSQAAEVAYGKRSVLDAAGTLGMEVMNSWSPMGTAPDVWQFFSPTLVDPLVQHGTNRTWAGSPIMPEARGYGPEIPDSQRHFKSVTTGSKWLAKWMNSVTGGDELESGLVDVSPEILDHYFEFLTGSTGRAVQRTIDIPMKLASGEVPRLSDIPVLRGFIGTPSEWFTSKSYYANRDNAEVMIERVKMYSERGEGEKAREIIKENNPLWKYQALLKATDKRIKELRKAMQRLPEDKQQPYLKQIDALQARYNKAVNLEK